MAIARYVKEIRNFIAPYFKQGSIVQITEHCCISIHNHEISLIHINKSGEQTELLSADTTQFENINSLQLVLSDLNKRYLLSATPTYWLLSPDDYQLFVTNSLPDGKEEFVDAIKWRTRSFLTYPIDEAMIDHFSLPAKKGEDAPMLALIVAKPSFVYTVINIMKSSGLNIRSIYIPELALRNLSALYETDDKSTGVIYFYDNGAILNISCQKALFFTCRLNWTSESAANPGNGEQLCRDIMRNFAYFQNQWQMPEPGRIFVAADKSNVEEISKTLSPHLSVQMQPYDIMIQSKGNTPFITIDNPFLLPYGCAIQEK